MEILHKIFKMDRKNHMIFGNNKAKCKPKIPPLDARLARNPRYENMTPTVDCGYNIRKQREK